MSTDEIIKKVHNLLHDNPMFTMLILAGDLITEKQQIRIFNGSIYRIKRNANSKQDYFTVTCNGIDKLIRITFTPELPKEQFMLDNFTEKAEMILDNTSTNYKFAANTPQEAVNLILYTLTPMIELKELNSNNN